jgi:signal transduction histidine kinase/CheY-like chemotaxis protein/HPt (histidine-containing phosphotransfer) domain-containing protein
MRSRWGAALSQAGIIAAAAALIALAWLGAISAINAERNQVEARVETTVGVEAVAFEQQVHRELLALDQTLHVLRHEWEQNPTGFDLNAWRSQAVLLNQAASSIFLTDANGVVRAAGTPGMIGLDLSGDALFRALIAQTATTEQLYVGPAVQGRISQEWHMNLALPLRHKDGSFAGVIGIAYQTEALARFFREARLGPKDMIAVVGTSEGRLRAEVGPIPVAPDASLRGSGMLVAIEQMPDGEWIGPSAPDGIERIHAFRHVPGEAMEVVVGFERSAALGSSTTWTRGARLFAGGITALVLLMAALLLREVRAAHRRSETREKEHTRLAASHAELNAARTRADAKTAQLEATLAGMTDGVAMVDPEHCLMEWNDQFSDISGVPPSLLRVGLTMEDMIRIQAERGEFGPVDVEQEIARRMILLRTGRLTETTERARPDGRIIELRRNYLPDGGMVTLYTDITARKQVENALRMARAAAEEATAAKSRFVAIVSHEIRTPLNALLGSLQLLAEGDLAPPQRTLLEISRQSGDALISLINDILDMSRLEAGQLSLRRSVFALRPLLNGALEMLRPLAGRRGITLRLVLDDDVPHLLYTDPVRLRQVLLNLLSNAAKYAAPGEVLLTGERHDTDDRPGMRLAVRDQGPVIPEDERTRLFQPFSQLDQPGAEVQPGSGLGLAICRLLAGLLGGEVGYATVVLTPMGQPTRNGNEFWVTAPIAPLPPDAAVPVDRPQAELPVLPRTRILLAEDVIASRIVVARLLRRAGHMVDTVGTGEDAIKAVARAPYDAVLMDVHMPGISGIDAARQMRTLQGAGGAVPIIALTGTLTGEDAVQCRAAGMNGVLSKPASLAEMINALAQHVWPGAVRGVQRVPHAPEISGASVADAPILAAGRLEELRRHLPPTTLGKLVEDCLLDLRTRLPQLRDAFDGGDIEDIISVAHTMAGVAGSYGMAALDAKMRAVMIAARQHGPDAAATMAGDVEADLTRAAAALRDFLSIETV